MSVVRRSALALAVLVAALTPAAALAHGHGAAHHSLRASVTDQNFYFVMADRFDNGDTANDNGGLPPRQGEGQSGFDPTGQGLLPRRRPQGPDREARLHPGARHDRDLADPELQEQGGPAAGQAPPATTATGSPTSRRSTRTSAPTRTCADLVDARAHARHEGLLRHHRQPHRRRHPLHARAPRAHAVHRPRTRRPTGPRRAPRSTTATSPARTRSRALADRPAVVLIAGRARQLPLPPVRAGRRAQRQGPGLAQRRDPLPQPRRHDVHRRELPVRRLLRPRRPLHREPAGRQRDDRHLRRRGSATSASTASGSTR